MPPMTLLKRRCTCKSCREDLYASSPHAGELVRHHRYSHLKFFRYDCLQLALLAKTSFAPEFGDSQEQSTPGCSAKLPTRNQAKGASQAVPTTAKKETLKKKGSLLSTAISPLSAWPALPPYFCWAQSHAIVQWKEWLASEPAQAFLRPGFDVSTHDPWELLQTPIKVFDQLFFLGQLPTHKAFMTIRWSPKLGYRGQTSTPKGFVTIEINPHHRMHLRSAEQVLNTLLHEMCHAFLQLFSCYDGSGCKENRICEKLRVDNHGSTGHGRAWQVLAAAIERVAPQLLGWKVWLGRQESVCREIERRGWIPSNCDLKSCDLKRAFGESLRRRVQLLMMSRDDNSVTIAALWRWEHRKPRCPMTRGRRYSI